jgi:SAM-dependent methyltransferase
MVKKQKPTRKHAGPPRRRVTKDPNPALQLPARLQTPGASAAAGVRRLREQMLRSTALARAEKGATILGALARLEDAYTELPKRIDEGALVARPASRGRRHAAQAAAPPYVAPRQGIPFVPSPMTVVEAMLELARVGSGDVVYDLGCGDGRIVIAAARRGARGIGVDNDPDRIGEASSNAELAGVSDRVTFRQGDLYDARLDEATVVALYLSPSVIAELQRTVLRGLRPGTRVVSHAFSFEGWQPVRTVEADNRNVFLWEVPG